MMTTGLMPNSRISVRHLRSFVMVARQGSLTKASKALFVTQSALSLTIHHLEEDLGVKLFDRTTRRIELTTAGEEFLDSAERLIRDFDSTLRSMRALGQRKRGSVGVAVVPSVMASLLPDSAARYIAEFPGIDVRLWEDTARNIQMHVLRGRIDFGISSLWFPNTDLAFEPMFDDHYGVVVAPGHPFAARKGHIEWMELEPMQLVGYSVDLETQNQLAYLPGIVDHLRAPRYQASNAAAIATLVRTGLGISVMSALSARRPPLHRLTFKPLHSPGCVRTVGVLYRNEKSLSPAAAELLKEIRRDLPKLARLPGIRVH
ncbi:MAG: LysR family transcriptional regulator [Pigmentiphaga sp.]|uniref:LysR family transcriptional regulator n=1 Tax=Pigmentiphaga sp. TaxID=1977564 RepID=UPI0029BE3CE8|nr:LysR family transcriptional regulator [Pigmentiphaga sp.]MDX3907362.1 LysR family transcriptional regulator [Pigmentiphaga sp.]